MENSRGLTPDEAAQRLKDEGPNELALSKRRSTWDIVLEVVREPMFMLLIDAGAIYMALGDATEASILLGFVLLIMGVTVLQEWRTALVLMHWRLSPGWACCCLAWRWRSHCRQVNTLLLASHIDDIVEFAFS